MEIKRIIERKSDINFMEGYSKNERDKNNSKG